MIDIKNNLAEIKRVGIIKDYKEIIKPDGTKEYDIVFYSEIPPERALSLLNSYLFEKYGLIL